jgi:integrase
MMIDAAIPIAKVSRHMGHSSIAITERVYFQLLPDAPDDDRAAMDAYFGEG